MSNLPLIESMRLAGFHKKFKLRCVILGISVVFILHFFGAFTHIFELNFFDNFSYPYPGYVGKYVKELRQGLSPEVKPVNVYNQTFLTDSAHKCSANEKIRLVYIVKSAVDNFGSRQAIRSSWGFEKRFSDVNIRTVFILGTTSQKNVQSLIDVEIEKHKDIVQVDFVDTYFNNTYKTMNGIRWAATFCSNADFYFFSDDDMYTSTKNVLRFLRNPTNYPQYLESTVSVVKADIEANQNGLYKNGKKDFFQMIDFELPQSVVLYAGYVFFTPPHRHRLSKWYVSLSEYPFHLWPPYATAGSYVLSREALLEMYFTSHYTKHFRFDDIYLGLVAIKAAIEPFHCDEFHFYKKTYVPSLNNYKYVISSHGYEDPEELVKVWSEQKSLGNA